MEGSMFVSFRYHYIVNMHIYHNYSRTFGMSSYPVYFYANLGKYILVKYDLVQLCFKVLNIHIIHCFFTTKSSWS